jgi:hypothetical protein
MSLISSSREVQSGNLGHMCIALLNCSPECLAPQARRIQSTRRVLSAPYERTRRREDGRTRIRENTGETGEREYMCVLATYHMKIPKLRSCTKYVGVQNN